jgi:hypothetical protein
MRRLRPDLAALLNRVLTHGEVLEFPLGTFYTDGSRVWEEVPNDGQEGTEAAKANHSDGGDAASEGTDR